MKLRKVFLILCLCIAVAFTFAACGGDDGEDADYSEEPAAEEEAGGDEAGGAADMSTLEGEWTVQSLTTADGTQIGLEDAEQYDLDPSQMQATLVFDAEGNLTYSALGQELGGTCEFDGETIAITFENGYEMPVVYDAENDVLNQTNQDNGLTLTYYRS